MFSSFWKVLPALTIGLGVGAEAQNVIAQKSTKTQSYHNSTAAPCGLHEGDCSCLARSCCCAMGGALELDLLVWRAENPGFTVGYEQTSTLNANSYTNNVGNIQRLDAKWSPGFRLGVGYNSDFDRWDVFADWTWFKNSSSESWSRDDATAGNHIGFYPQWPIETTHDLAYKHLHGSWHMQHNAFDLELGRAYYLTKAISLRPHWGLRGGWINQKFKSAFSSPVDTAYGSTHYDFHGKNNFWGVGPRLGVHGQWHIDSSSWSILGKASTALLLGETKTYFLTEYVSAGVLTTERNYNDQFSHLVPNLQIFLGIDWGSCLDCNKYYLGLNVGWETNIYWNQFNIPSSVYEYYAPLPGSNGQAVTMEGVTFNLHLDY